MDDRLKREDILVTELESGGEDRSSKQTELDSLREDIERESSVHPMDFIYTYLKDHETKRGWQKAYNGKGFTNAQFLVSSLMSPSSPLRSLLLYHGVGVGKTCAAIAAASNYQGSKQIIVLTPSETLVKNWKEEFIGKNYCGRYIWNVDKNDWEKLTQRQKILLLNQHVVFMGYLKFANRVQQTATQIETRNGHKNDSLVEAVRLHCNNTLIIMDEIHSTRQIASDSTKEEDLKKIRPVLEAIARYAKQSKLLLLSATPMYNDVREIEWIINLLRWNQGLSPMSWNKWYNAKKNDWLQPKRRSVEYFMSKIRGFISFIRGENPHTFPRRLYPESSTINMDGVILYESKMSQEQTDFVKQKKEESKDAFASSVIQNTLSSQQYLSASSDNKWSPELVQKWAPKLWSCWTQIKQCRGPSFVYSQYLTHGIYEMARTLEMLGWKRESGSSFLSKEEQKTVEPFCWNHRCKKSEIPKVSDKPFMQAKYALVDGNSKNLYEILSIMNRESNMDGSKCAALLGSRVIEVGVSLKCIRQVHILEPWFHMNSMEQAIGRAVRNRSHIRLPKDERNVTIYLHCATYSDEDSIDITMYKTAIDKMRMMGEATRYIAEQAIDCYIQTNINYIRDRNMIQMKDSVGNMREIMKGDQDFSARCHYSKCEISCGAVESSEEDTLQYLNLNAEQLFPTHFSILMERMPAVIQSLPVITHESLASALGTSTDITKKLLQTYIKEKRSFINIQGIPTYLIQLEDNLYMTNVYSNHILPLESVGQAPVEEEPVTRLNDIKIESEEPVVETTIETRVETDDKIGTDKRFLQMMEELIEQIQMIEGPTPATQNLREKGILERNPKNGKRLTNVQIDDILKERTKISDGKKSNIAFMRFAAYPSTKQDGDLILKRNELYSSIIVSFVEHLVDKQVFLQSLIEAKSDMYPQMKYLIRSLKEEYLNEKGLGMTFIPFLMDFQTHVAPYVSREYRETISKQVNEASLNAYCYTEKKQLHIYVWKKDESWIQIPQGEILDWKLSIQPMLIEARQKDHTWIDAWIDPKSYRFFLRINRLSPKSSAITVKKKEVKGGVCGQTEFVKRVPELVNIIETLVGVKYLAITKRGEIRVKENGKTFKITIPSGIYYPRQPIGEKLLESAYFSSVNKQASKSSTGASLCEELEYIIRIIGNSGKMHPMEPYVNFSSSLEQFVQN